MNEDERLYEQYEDAFFALLMNRVAEANGKELMQIIRSFLQIRTQPFPKV